MKKIYTFAAIAAAILAAVSCSKEQQVSKGNVITKTIELGFADEAVSVDSKTYMANYSTGEVRWASSGADLTVHAFTGDNVRYAFNSSSSKAEKVRSFTCDTWPADAWMKLITWHGKTSTNAVLDGWKLTGSNVEIKSTQNINNSNSFDNSQNIVVMKPGDTGLRSVFGFLRYYNPPFDYYTTQSHAGIKKVVITADEDIAGKVEVDYSGDDPVCRFISGTSKSITINARIKGSGPTGAEGGFIYVPMIPGTYHGLKMEITPYAEEPIHSPDDAALGTPFTITAKGSIVIERAKYTDAGTLPTSQPAAFAWPNDTDAFDYGLAEGQTKVADMSNTTFEAAGIVSGSSNKVDVLDENNTVRYQRNEDRVPDPGATVDNIYWLSHYTTSSASNNQGQYVYKNNIGCILYNAKKGTETTLNGGVKVPSDPGLRFKINKPGTFKMFMRLGSGDPSGWTGSEQQYNAVLETTKNGQTSAKTIYQYVPDADHVTNSYSVALSNNDDYCMVFTVTEEMLWGIDHAATLYVWHVKAPGSAGNKMMYYYPPKWTAAVLEP